METSRRKRIGVLLGGESAERDISLRCGQAVLSALADRGHRAIPIHVDRDLDVALRQERIDVAYIAMRGRAADGPVQGLLETLGIPYTGSSFAAASLASDKLKSKELFRLHNLPTPAYYRHSREMGGTVEQHHSFGFPCVVKPRSGGSGIGVSLVRDEHELEIAVESALRFDDDVIVERHIPGCEVHVAIVDGRVLGAAEIVSDGGILDYATKMTPGRTHVFVPPRLGNERLRGAVTQAVRAHHLFGCGGATRVDMIVSERENEMILEVDCLPELSPGALVPKLAHAAQLDFGALVQQILDGARLHAGNRTHERAGAVPGFHARERSAGESVEPH